MTGDETERLVRCYSRAQVKGFSVRISRLGLGHTFLNRAFVARAYENGAIDCKNLTSY